MSGCERALDLIGLRLDGPLSPEEQRELDAHLEQCPACRAAARELEAFQPEIRRGRRLRQRRAVRRAL